MQGLRKQKRAGHEDRKLNGQFLIWAGAKQAHQTSIKPPPDMSKGYVNIRNNHTNGRIY